MKPLAGIREQPKQEEKEEEEEEKPASLRTAACAHDDDDDDDNKVSRSIVVAPAPSAAPATTTAVDNRTPTRGPPSITTAGMCPYRDFAAVTEKSPLLREMMLKNNNSSRTTFPCTLHRLLEVMENQGLMDIACWHEHGRSFIISDQTRFVDEILPAWFRQRSVASFQRQLNIYGFLRIPKGIEKGGYYHELFLRGKPFLSEHIKRIKVKGTKTRKSIDPSHFPSFQDFPPVWKVLSDLHGHRSSPGVSHPFLSPPPRRKVLKNSSTHDKRGEGKKRTPPRQSALLDMGTPTSRAHASARAPVANQEPSPLLHPLHEPFSGSSSLSSSLPSLTTGGAAEANGLHQPAALTQATIAGIPTVGSRERSKERVHDPPSDIMTLEREDERMLIQQDYSTSLGSVVPSHHRSFATATPMVVQKLSTLSDGGMLAVLVPRKRGLQALDQGDSDHYLLQAGVELVPLLPRSYPPSSSIAMPDWPVSNTDPN